uniref:Uncharacterized protein n=1 Tax=Nelumbo nucifera TaxID=4432 RepID=A0A822YMU7_NELNU|nr:TPA_asm: hypothetical protein HUJ06_012791 [Nelumbo nucifera]
MEHVCFNSNETRAVTGSSENGNDSSPRFCVSPFWSRLSRFSPSQFVASHQLCVGFKVVYRLVNIGTGNVFKQRRSASAPPALQATNADLLQRCLKRRRRHTVRAHPCTRLPQIHRGYLYKDGGSQTTQICFNTAYVASHQRRHASALFEKTATSYRRVGAEKAVVALSPFRPLRQWLPSLATSPSGVALDSWFVAKNPSVPANAKSIHRRRR